MFPILQSTAWLDHFPKSRGELFHSSIAALFTASCLILAWETFHCIRAWRLKLYIALFVILLASSFGVFLYCLNHLAPAGGLKALVPTFNAGMITFLSALYFTGFALRLYLVTRGSPKGFDVIVQKDRLDQVP